ncbi:pca operon transcription factor PcaQ [Phaeobacter sp. 11ANDIMAR09]|uniref:pca operon transcription factor PcaQ n=1 Tax=Phaeobacter sp. 11ANDIMAR09 TaxID=1225647 RepID=UPI0006C8324B|nr:pca operon transcription factor PcaQ [Phaeobacter sp. 11ANDIMAR09]KPD14122.1 LysR family transcriptional regulator [Phaeobacter sp. 11ANDIMAR09]OIQ35464.1 MAG: pca operon transcription factor PcaQ [Roseobacter sp. MedPE-SWchi]
MRLSAHLKLRHLEVFVEVARQTSVTQAAEALGMTQPAVTRALRELEAVCGKPLVERHGRGIRLSPYGEMFRHHAGRSLALARDGVAMLQGLEADEGPQLRIGALPTVSATLVPDALAQMQAGMARSRFLVNTGGNQYLLDQLRRGDLDLVVGRLPAPERMVGIDFEPLFHERVAVVVASEHPLAGLGHLPVEALQSYPVLMPAQGSIIRPLVEQMFLEQGLVMPQAPIETVSATFGRRFVLDHGAIWFISQGVVRADLAAGIVHELPLDTTSTLGPVGLCIRSEHQLSATGARFCACLRDLCG